MLTFVASAVAGKTLKGLVAIWIKDKSFLEVGSDLVLDSLQSKSGDYLQGRKISRLFEQIEDDIVEALATHLSSEFSQIKKGDRALLAEAAVDLISTSAFYDACFEEIFDLERLVTRFRTEMEGSADRLFIGDKYAAVQIGAFVIAKYLAILQGLPTFSIDTLKAVLRDTDEILDRVRNLEIQITSFTIRKKIALEEEEEDYRRMMSKRMRKIYIFGVDSRGFPKNMTLQLLT